MKLASEPTRNFSLASQYAATIIVLIVIGMGTLAGTMLYSQIQQNDRYIHDFGQIIAKQLAASAVEPLFADERFELQVLLNNFSLNQHIVSTAIFSVDKELIASKGQLPSLEEIHFDEPYYKLGNTWRFNYTLEPHLVVHTSPIIFKGVTAGFAIVVFTQDLLSEQFQQQLYLMGGIFLVLLIAVIAGGILVSKRLTQPIKTLVDAAESIRTGRIDQIADRRNDEIGTLIDSINNMSQGLIRKNQVESMLNRFLTKDVATKVMDQLDPVQMAGEHVYATVLFADIVGFTSISEKISPQEVQKLLNEYYAYFNSCARFYFGTVDKYIGDCVMVVFGAPKEDPKHQYNAVACAILMQKLAERLNKRRNKQGQFPISLRIGINSGRMLAGLIGSKERMEYTVVGDAVNLASRLCSEAESAQIIIEESLYHAVDPDTPLTVEAFKEIRVRGKEQPVNIYSVKDIKHPRQVAMDDLINDILSQPL